MSARVLAERLERLGLAIQAVARLKGEPADTALITEALVEQVELTARDFAMSYPSPRGEDGAV